MTWVVFRQFNKSEVHTIAENVVSEFCERLEKMEIDLYVTESFRKQLVLKGYSSEDGARPLRRNVTVF